MAWIKRNLIFVVTMIVGLALAGVAGYFVYTAAGAEGEAKDQYTSALNDLTTLQQKNPLPSKANIEIANDDSARVANLAKNLGSAFVNFPAPPALDAREFIDYLNTNLNSFRLMATNANVTLIAPDYAFSFGAEANTLSFPTSNFKPWEQEMEQIKAIVAILCNAKINSLDMLQRAPMGGEDANAYGPDYVPNATVVSNQTEVELPYRIAFHCFSGEVAKVLVGFAQSDHCFLVKDIDVTTSASVPGYAEPTYAQPAAAAVYQPQIDSRYRQSGIRGDPRRRGRPMFMPPPEMVQAAVAAPAAPTGPETILKPMPLFVTITVDAVELKNAH
jgi:hypothetical protein